LNNWRDCIFSVLACVYRLFGCPGSHCRRYAAPAEFWSGGGEGAATEKRKVVSRVIPPEMAVSLML
jgi:hypothetical protein